MMLTDGIATVVRGQTVPFILDRLGGNMENEIVLALVFLSPSSLYVSKIKSSIKSYFPPLAGNFLCVYEIYKHSFVLGMPD